VVFLLLAGVSGTASVFGQLSKKEKIDSLMNAMYRRGEFTGAILVADHGQVIYENAFGLSDRKKQIPFQTSTQEYIGSISKQFTAMGIMILKDRGKLRYDQSIRDFFPELPAFTQGVTIKNLLYHTSGLDVFDDFPDMTEKDVLNILVKQNKLRFTPGEKFEYCNAGYSLLGQIIEKVSGEGLNAFMTENIFRPLGMNHTEVNEISHRNTSRAVGYDMFGNVSDYDSFMGGNVSVISTVGDMYLWDDALYHFKLVSAETLSEAFAMSNEEMKNRALLLQDNMFGDKSYGFGIWIAMHKGKKDFFHDGAFAGFQSYNERITSDHISIIELSNMRRCDVYGVREAIVNILENKVYRLPKISGAVWLNKKIAVDGIEAAVSAYREFRGTDTANYDYSEGQLNSYAYILLRGGRVDESIKVFKLNTELFPNSFNVFDSIADAYEKAGNKDMALKSRMKALELDPTNEYEKEQVKALQAK